MPMKMNMTFWTPPMPHWCVMWIVCSFTGPMLPKPRIRPWCRFCTWRCGCTQMHLGNGFRIKSFGSFGKGFGFYMSRAGLVMRLSSPKRCAAAAVSGACHFLCNLSTYLQQFPTKNPPLELGFVTYWFLIEGILASSFYLFTLLTTTTSPWSWWFCDHTFYPSQIWLVQCRTTDPTNPSVLTWFRLYSEPGWFLQVLDFRWVLRLFQPTMMLLGFL